MRRNGYISSHQRLIWQLRKTEVIGLNEEGAEEI
jgi:hypothetical protein